MQLNNESLTAVKVYLADGANNDIYYQLKEYVSMNIGDDESYSEALEWFVENLIGSLVWDDNV